jgi:nucleoside transporter
MADSKRAYHRLAALFFLQFAVWGCFLTSLGQLLGSAGLGAHIPTIYATTGIVSLFSPAIMCHIADRYLSARRTLSICHIIGAIFMLGAWHYAYTHPHMQFTPFYVLYFGFLSFFMPTIPLSTTVAFQKIKAMGNETAQMFPRIRIWGTVGFVAAMWFVNCAYVRDGSFGFTLNEDSPYAATRFQYTSMQLLATSIVGIITALYNLSLPEYGKRQQHPKESLAEILGVDALRLFKQPLLRRFFIIAIFAGVCTQIGNGYATSFISQFASESEYATSLVAGNATMLFSLSNISEAASILVVGYALRRLGIRYTLFIAMAAWTARFALFAFGNPGSGLWMLILSMGIFGIAFNFYNIAGMLYVEGNTDAEHKALGQGLLMMMSTGVGSTVGMVGAGAVINHFCRWHSYGDRSLLVGDWTSVWLIFAAYTLILAVSILLALRHNKKTSAQN